MQGTNKVLEIENDHRDLILSTGFALFRPTQKVLTRYIKYWLVGTTFNKMKDRLCTGATQKAINNRAISQLEIPLAPSAEQERIVRILDEADGLQNLRAEADRRTADLIPAIFHDMFGDPATNPKGWCMGSLADLCEEVVDCPHSTPRYAVERTSYACVRSSDLQNGKMDWSRTKFVDQDEYLRRTKRLTPMPRDVVYCREGGRFGNAAQVPEEKTICLGQRMMLFRAAPNEATPEFLWAVLTSQAIYKQAANKLGGSASPHVNVKDIKLFTTCVPPFPLQHEFSARVKEVRDLEAKQAASRQRLDGLFESLLYRAFRGEL